jgi:hypothetical protein
MQWFDSQIIEQTRYGTRQGYVNAVVVMGIVLVAMRFLSIKRGFVFRERTEQKDGIFEPGEHLFIRRIRVKNTGKSTSRDFCCLV